MSLERSLPALGLSIAVVACQVTPNSVEKTPPTLTIPSRQGSSFHGRSSETRPRELLWCPSFFCMRVRFAASWLH